MVSSCFRFGFTSSQPGKRVNLARASVIWSCQEFEGSSSARSMNSNRSILSSRVFGFDGSPLPINTRSPDSLGWAARPPLIAFSTMAQAANASDSTGESATADGPPRADADPEGAAEPECGRLDAETSSAGTNAGIAPKGTAGTAGLPDARAANKEVTPLYPATAPKTAISYILIVAEERDNNPPPPQSRDKLRYPGPRATLFGQAPAPLAFLRHARHRRHAHWCYQPPHAYATAPCQPLHARWRHAMLLTLARRASRRSVPRYANTITPCPLTERTPTTPRTLALPITHAYAPHHASPSTHADAMLCCWRWHVKPADATHHTTLTQSRHAHWLNAPYYAKAVTPLTLTPRTTLTCIRHAHNSAETTKP